MAHDSTQTSERQATELALLASMYPTEYQPLQSLCADETAKCALHLQRTFPASPAIMLSCTAVLAEVAD